MTKFLIIAGTQDSGKTTTAGMVYKELLLDAKDVHLTDGFGNALPIDDVLFENGKPKDFIAYMVVKDKKVVIVSIGDSPQYLKKQIENYLNEVAYFVCCLRTQNREGSSRRMVFADYVDYLKEEFWIEYSEDETQKFAVKEKTVNQIVSVIKNVKPIK